MSLVDSLTSLAQTKQFQTLLTPYLALSLEELVMPLLHWKGVVSSVKAEEQHRKGR